MEIINTIKTVPKLKKKKNLKIDIYTEGNEINADYLEKLKQLYKDIKKKIEDEKIKDKPGGLT